MSKIPESAVTGSRVPGQARNPRGPAGTAPGVGTIVPADGRVVLSPQLAPGEKSRDLTEPMPLPDCICGGDVCKGCWYGLMRKHGLGPTQSLLDALEEVVAQPARRAGKP